MLSGLYHQGLMEAVAVPQTAVFEAAELFVKVEGIFPAPKSSHAIRVPSSKEKTIVFGLAGTGHFDMVAYEKFHDGKMSDYIPTDEDLQASFSTLPSVE